MRAPLLLITRIVMSWRIWGGSRRSRRVLVTRLERGRRRRLGRRRKRRRRRRRREKMIHD